MMRVRSSLLMLVIGLSLALFASSTISGALTLVQADRGVSGTLKAGDLPIPVTTGLSGAQGSLSITSSRTVSYGTITNNTGSSMTLSIRITPAIVGANGKKWDMHFKISTKDFRFKYNSYSAVTFSNMVLASGTSWQIYSYYNTSSSHDGTVIHFAYTITVTSPTPSIALTDTVTTPLYMQIIC